MAHVAQTLDKSLVDAYLFLVQYVGIPDLSLLLLLLLLFLILNFMVRVILKRNHSHPHASKPIERENQASLIVVQV
jgi:hypothetical protein